jgi:hypothetical protein
MVMRNRLLIGFACAAVTAMAVPAAAQVEVQRQPDSTWTADGPDAVDEGQYAVRDARQVNVDVNADNGFRSFGFGVHVEGGGSANEYGPYGYPERGYGVYAQWGSRDRGYSDRSYSLRRAYDMGRRDGYDAGFDAARDGRWDWRDHRYYRSTRGYDRRFGARDGFDLNYRNGFRSGYEQGYREGRRQDRRNDRRRW